MSSLPRPSMLLKSEKIDDVYSSYKYEQIKSEWIIHQGNLEYLYGHSLFKTALFRKYHAVLTCLVEENLVILFLYPEKTKNLYKYFELEKNDQLNDRCRKLIEGKAGLFFLELITHRRDRGEIFGVQSVPERKLWIGKFNEAISKLGSRTVHRSISDVPRVRGKSSGEDRSFSEEPNPIIYPSFTEGLPMNIPARQPHCTSDDMEYMDTVYTYGEAKAKSLKDTDDKGKFSWKEIFHSNVKNDFTTVLNNIARTGRFLIRPDVQQSSSNGQQYILCVYDDGQIHKFNIHQSSDGRYQLIYRENESSFDKIPELCQYYTTHPLYIIDKNELNKPLYLTFPFTYQNLYY